MLTFEVYRKRGRHWQYIGNYDGQDSVKAARKAGYKAYLPLILPRYAGVHQHTEKQVYGSLLSSVLRDDRPGGVCHRGYCPRSGAYRFNSRNYLLTPTPHSTLT